MSAKDKRKQTNLERYGVENPFQSKEAKKRRKQTSLEKYGVEHPMQSKEVQNKRRILSLEKYGVDHHWQFKEVQDKRKQTNLERYGVENPFQSKIIQEKAKKTNLERFGTEHPMQSQIFQEKAKKTNLERYGVEYSSQNENVKNRAKCNNIEKYGVRHANQKHYSKDTISKLNSFEYLYEEYVNKNKTTIQIGNELGVDGQTVCNYLHIHNIPIFHIAKFSKKAIQWLESIMDKEDIYIQHAGNEGEYRIPGTRYSVDGYYKDSRTVYEFYGDFWHGNLNIYREDDHPHPFNPNITTIDLYNKTIERENRIRELGYNIVSIWEKEWLTRNVD